MSAIGRVRERQFRFDLGDWVAVRDDRAPNGYRLAGLVVDADSESITVKNRDGLLNHFAVGEDPIGQAYWRTVGGSRRGWYVR